MLKETEQAIVFLISFLSLVTFRLVGARDPCPPLATPMLCIKFTDHEIKDYINKFLILDMISRMKHACFEVDSNQKILP